MKLKFTLQILKKKKKGNISNFMKIRPLGAELFLAEEHTGRHGMKKLIAAFRNFANAPKNILSKLGFELSITLTFKLRKDHLFLGDFACNRKNRVLASCLSVRLPACVSWAVTDLSDV